MANYIKYHHSLKVTIPDVESVNSITHYKIFVTMGMAKWTVSHRYNDFVELNERLIFDNIVPRGVLPSKKTHGNTDYVEARRLILEKYIRTVTAFLHSNLPRCLLIFLDFHKYEVMCVLQEMNSFYYHEGDALLSKSTAYSLNTLELHAISERLKIKSKMIQMFEGEDESKYLFSHVVNFVRHLTSITVRGGMHRVGTSNIIYNVLPFDLIAFGSISNLIFLNVSPNLVQDLGIARQNVSGLTAYNSSLKRYSDILLCDQCDRRYDHTNQKHPWKRLAKIDISWNEIKGFSEHLKLVPNIQYLTMDGNEIETLNDIQYLPKLLYLSLSSNGLSVTSCLRDRLPRITTLILSQNKITLLEPFAQLKTLRKLDLGSNLVDNLKEVDHLCKLNLESLILNGNPISTNVDYRIAVFGYFADHARKLCLDCERPSQKELSKSSIYRTIVMPEKGNKHRQNGKA